MTDRGQRAEDHASRKHMIGAILIVGFFVIGAVVLVGVRSVALCLFSPLIDSEQLRRVDAIVVLGAGAFDDEIVAPDTAYRLMFGLTLLKKGFAPVMIVSGGSHRQTRKPDAVVMRNVALGLGIPPTEVILDPTPSTTRGQALSIADLARQRGLGSILLVTSPLHSYRAVRAFRRTGLEVVSAPGPSSLTTAPSIILVAQDHVAGRLKAITEALYEYAAIVVYWWRRWI